MAMMKKAVKAMTTPNNIQNGGGLSSLLIPVKASPLGVGTILAGMTGYGIVKETVSAKNRAKMGKITYSGGPARMTGQFTSGIPEAMLRSSGGNPQVLSEMVSNTMQGDGLAGAIETYGVTPNFISALYGMGGR